MTPRPRYSFRLRGQEHTLGDRTWVMGVLNVTPDSFSDGGRFFEPALALQRGHEIFAQGADIVDVGGESTRPGGAERVSAEEELRRVLPVLRGLRAAGAGLLSIDTSRAEVARAALEAGADLVNDVSGLSFDPGLAGVLAEAAAPAVLMHLRGSFDSMHSAAEYADVVSEVKTELGQALERARRGGVPLERLLLDPGIGFAKRAPESLTLLRRLGELHTLGRPLLVGPSRKSFIGHVLGLPADERVFGTAAAVTQCVLAGAHIVRVHDVREMVQVVRLADALRGDAVLLPGQVRSGAESPRSRTHVTGAAGCTGGLGRMRGSGGWDGSAPRLNKS